MIDIDIGYLIERHLFALVMVGIPVVVLTCLWAVFPESTLKTVLLGGTIIGFSIVVTATTYLNSNPDSFSLSGEFVDASCVYTGTAFILVELANVMAWFGLCKPLDPMVAFTLLAPMAGVAVINLKNKSWSKT